MKITCCIERYSSITRNVEKTKNKMANINQTVSIMILMLVDWTSNKKSERILGWITSYDTTIYAMNKRHTLDWKYKWIERKSLGKNICKEQT